MTREEAKEILTHNWTRVDNPNYSESELDEAFFMAIEALSVANLKEEFGSAEYEDYEHATLVDIKEPLKVLVVRCKDCRYHGMRNCPVWGDDTTEDYMWCYYGERKE